jgi:hypothetical protein
VKPVISRRATDADKSFRTLLIENIKLATEWNHIEAGLAYARDLPLLVIHHKDVIRGIFDRGAPNSFIYEFDLSNDSWALSSEMTIILKKWRNECLIRDRKEKRRIEKLDKKNKLGSGTKVTIELIRNQKICIKNHGPEEAKNVNVSFPDNNVPIFKSEYKSKLPIQSLPVGIQFNLIASISYKLSPPFNAKLEWEDSTGHSSKIFPLT